MNVYLTVLWESLLVFILLVVLARMMGKKLLSQLTFFDFVVGITIGTIAGGFISTSIKGLQVLLSPIILTIATIGAGILTVKSLPARKLLEGEPVVVIQNGKIMEKNMGRSRYHLDDLHRQLREQGIFDIGQVEFAVLEPHGVLSILKKTQYQPVTPKDLKLPTNYEGMASEIIKDGQVLEQNLVQNNLSFEWLYQELHRRNIANINDVFFAGLNTDGTLYIDLKKDELGYIQRIED
ncbi:MAG: YetF domain-containing protein [Candidatus Saccharibacteria bacterium]